MSQTRQMTPKIDPVIRIRLSIMMFGEFFVWGGWFVTLGTYLEQSLQASGSQIALAALTQSLGAIIAPFIVGRIADRFFSAQKIMGALHLAGGVLLLLASRAGSFAAFFPLALINMILFMPTLALANAVAFRQLQDPGRQFGSIRVLGSIGWIVAGLLIGWLGWEQSHRLDLTLVMAGVGAVVLGLYCFTLPSTPPQPTQASTWREILGLDALALLKNRTYLVFFVSSIAICVPLAFYYNFTNLWLNESGVKSAAAIQTIGQMSEVGFLLAMPLLIKKLGFKKTLAMGMAAWAVRYVCFGLGDTGPLFFLIIIGLVLHGVCYDFFFVAGQIYTDRYAGPGLRSSAQGLISLATYGVGLLIGSLISGPIVDAFSRPGGHAWLGIWLIPAAIAACVLAAFWTLFHDAASVRVQSVAERAA